MGAAAVATLLLLIAGVWHDAVGEKTRYKLPETFKRCRRNDPDLNTCLYEAIRDAITQMKEGIPELGLMPLDPLVISNIKVEEGVGRPVTMSLNLKNATLHGLGNIDLSAVRADLDNRKLEFEASVPETHIDADYTMNGRFLVLPMNGEGKCSLNLTQYNTTVKLHAEPLTKDDEVYWDVTEFDVHVESLQLFQVRFENLFNGNKTLGDNTNRVLNENWKEFFEELRPTLHDTFGGLFKKLCNVIFHKVPERDIFLED
ncbi:protein takeout-like [Periplaneta americana]|uniref:protein takeout-like n=1 Tax=Periplaneta americana TaxID=6978 RepID=UPI0037E8E3A5